MPAIHSGAIRFQNIQAVLFDKDGTLADSRSYLCQLGYRRGDCIEAIAPGVKDSLLTAFGLEGDRLNPAGLLAVGTRLENEIAAAAYVAQTGLGWMESLGRVRSAFVQADHSMPAKAHQTPLFEGTLNLLERLSAAGVQIGIVSSDAPTHVQAFVECYQLTPLVKVALGSLPELSKPDPRLVFQACQMLGVAPSATLVIGDAASDIDMAHNAATAGCIGVGWSGATPADLKHCNSFIQRCSEIEVMI